MIKSDDKNLCCGCGTCSLVCPKHCISFLKDALGHRIAHVDTDACINCSRCESVCPIQNDFENAKIGERAYVAFSKDDDVRFRASSGGVFETIASKILKDGGCVFASKFDKELHLKCFEASNEVEMRSLTKSKYLQSDCSNMFPIVKERILQGRKVLFSSTPCQVSALKKYLGKNALNENVFYIDFFCHGVPSQIFFDLCRSYVERKNNLVITNYEFRTKIKNGATPHYFTLEYEKNGVKKRKTSLYVYSPFYLAFQKYITLRDSCYQCPYAYGNHESDITMGDFHDVDKYVSGINRFDGVSTVLVNNSKGFFLWNSVKDSFDNQELDIKLLHHDHQIYPGPTAKPLRRDELIDDIKHQSFDVVVDKWFNKKQEWQKIIYYRLPKFIRFRLKKLCGL